eukprot:TRINITY_DN8652_c0_g1_i1.p3 TRINITY_DN8652_c0_g1~~TRINITY_DN8652_c0_g1_i1.p3  ORF type:complete len:142 (+),score=18.44 TRINITY_DN8652_c0_g1_i1:2011-2436(+)
MYRLPAVSSHTAYYESAPCITCRDLRNVNTTPKHVCANENVHTAVFDASQGMLAAQERYDQCMLGKLMESQRHACMHMQGTRIFEVLNINATGHACKHEPDIPELLILATVQSSGAEAELVERLGQSIRTLKTSRHRIRTD